MKFLCVFASMLLAVSGYRIMPQYNETNPYQVECGGWYGFFDVVNPSVTGSRTIVSSSNFGKGNYANNEKCFIQFVTGDWSINLRLNFTDFELEYGYGCSWDSLCVDGFEYCGITLQGGVLSFNVPANSSFTLVFRSDRSITARGYKVIADVKRIDNEEINNYDYVDRCLERYQEQEEPSPTPIIDPYYPDYPQIAVDPTYNYPNTESDYPNTDSDYPNTDSDYANTDSDYPNSESDYPSTDSDYPSTDSDYPNTVSDYYGFHDFTSDYVTDNDASYEDYPVPGK